MKGLSDGVANAIATRPSLSRLGMPDPRARVPVGRHLVVTFVPSAPPPHTDLEEDVDEMLPVAGTRRWRGPAAVCSWVLGRGLHSGLGRSGGLRGQCPWLSARIGGWKPAGMDI